MRYFIRLQYDGTSFFGWQKLKNFPTVQGTIEKALSTLLQKTILIHGCGRTDRGVHAQEYFAHVDLPVIEISSLLYRVNQLLPNSIRIINFHLVPDNAHAQLDSICRTYQYRIHTKKNPFIYPFSYWYQKNLDSKLLEDASQIILRGEDFQNFTKSPQRQNSTK